jgi:hypothetical protein
MTTNTAPAARMSLTDLHREHAALGAILRDIPATDTQAYADLTPAQRKAADKHRRTFARRRADVRWARRDRLELLAARYGG